MNLKLFYTFYFLIVIFYHIPLITLVEAKFNGFSIELIHHESPFSPFYTNSSSPPKPSKLGTLRSISRAAKPHRSSPKSGFQTAVFPNEAEYLMKISIGSPPVERFATADTGSDLVWFQCAPCDQCYSQDTPIFDPSMSSTYKELSCKSKTCPPLFGADVSCAKTKHQCEYSYSYVDNSTAGGVLATETFSFDSSDGKLVKFPKIIFGCGHNNTESPGSGLVGLGLGAFSLISQLGPYIDHKFSYCLSSDTTYTTKLKFGEGSILSGKDVVSTPILSNLSYAVNLMNVIVGNKNLTSKVTPGIGITIIDSGTTQILLDSNLYYQVIAAFKEEIGAKPIADPSGQGLLCYSLTSLEKVLGAKMIKVVFHFLGGADVALSPVNLFSLENNNVSCLQIALSPLANGSIFGNLAQINFEVGYDLAKKQISFAPVDCIKYE